MDQKLTRRMWFGSLVSSVFGGWAATRTATAAEPRYRYTGATWPVTGLIQNRVALCDPSVGRWATMIDEPGRRCLWDDRATPRKPE